MTAPITAIVTAYRRIDQTLETLQKLKECSPPPSEILVHVDGNQADCVRAIGQAFPEIKVLVSDINVGPGGARNKLIAAAENEVVSSFDDDSYPIDQDYFARVHELMAQFPDAAILNAAVYHQGELQRADVRVAHWASDFSGGGCTYRRSCFLATQGYVPLPMAYGMEEVDLALRLHAKHSRILFTPWLRVYHDTDLSHHNAPQVTSASVMNLALLTFLRYPPLLWPVGIAQLFKRVFWLVTHGRSRGVLSGLFSIPMVPWRYGSFRDAVSVQTLMSYLTLRRNPVTATFPGSESLDAPAIVGDWA